MCVCVRVSVSLCVSYPLCQLRMCCGLQGGVGVAASSLEGVLLLWLCGDAATERNNQTDSRVTAPSPPPTNSNRYRMDWRLYPNLSEPFP